MTLWAVETESDYLAAPSSEAALAACTEPGDRIRPWFFDASWHAAESAAFLESWEPAVWH